MQNERSPHTSVEKLKYHLFIDAQDPSESQIVYFKQMYNKIWQKKYKLDATKSPK